MSSAADIPANLVAAITGNAAFPTEDGITHVEWRDIGVLPITSGRITACDPLMFGQPEPFDRTIDSGAYPLRLLIAHYNNDDQRIAAAVLVIDDSGSPIEWVLATTADQDIDELGADEIYGYPVDSGTSGFLDMDAVNALEAAMDDDHEYFERIIADMDATYEHTRSWAIHAINGDPQLCLAAFSSGLGDGVYPSYWGLSPHGRIRWLITEFGVM